MCPGSPLATRCCCTRITPSVRMISRSMGSSSATSSPSSKCSSRSPVSAGPYGPLGGRGSQRGDENGGGLAGEHGICDHGGGRRAVKGACMVEFLRSEDGQGLVEYALIIAVIAITVILAMVFFRDQLSNYFSNIGNKLT